MGPRVALRFLLCLKLVKGNTVSCPPASIFILLYLTSIGASTATKMKFFPNLFLKTSTSATFLGPEITVSQAILLAAILADNCYHLLCAFLRKHAHISPVSWDISCPHFFPNNITRGNMPKMLFFHQIICYFILPRPWLSNNTYNKKIINVIFHYTPSYFKFLVNLSRGQIL